MQEENTTATPAGTEIMQHLSAQDAELLKQTHMIIHLLKASGISLEQVTAIQNTGDVAAEAQKQG